MYLLWFESLHHTSFMNYFAITQESSTSGQMPWSWGLNFEGLTLKVWVWVLLQFWHVLAASQTGAWRSQCWNCIIFQFVWKLEANSSFLTNSHLLSSWLLSKLALGLLSTVVSSLVKKMKSFHVVTVYGNTTTTSERNWLQPHPYSVLFVLVDVVDSRTSSDDAICRHFL